MKKIYCVLLFCLSYYYQGSSQSVVELGVSYDQSVLEAWGSHGEIVVKINDIVFEISDRLQDLIGVKVVLKSVIYLPVNKNLFSNSSSIAYTSFLGYTWGTKICQSVDIAHHITIYDLPGKGGHANGGESYCNLLSGEDFSMSVSEQALQGIIGLRFFHEISHSLGAAHEELIDPSVCNTLESDYYMCSEGSTHDDISIYELSDANKNSILKNISQAPCMDSFDNNDPDCTYCALEWFLLYDQDATGFEEQPNLGFITKHFEYDCEHLDGIFEEEFEIKMMKGCSTESLNMSVQFDKDDFEFTEVPPGFVLDDSGIDKYRYTATFMPTEDLSLKFKFKVIDFTANPNPLTPATSIVIYSDKGPNSPQAPRTLLFKSDPYVSLSGQDVDLNDALISDLGMNYIEFRKATCGIDQYEGNPVKLRIHLDGTFRADEYNCFKNNTLITLSPGSQIYLADNNGGFASTFETENATFDVCGNEKWQGIVAKDPSRITIESTVISNADIGLQCNGSKSLSIQNSSFENNFIGIEMEQISGQDFMVDILYGNKFTSNDNYLTSQNFASLDPLTGVRLRNIPFAWFNDFQFSSLRNGILAYQSNLVVYSSTFEDIHPTSTDNNILTSFPSGNGVYHSGSGSSCYVNDNEFRATFRSVGAHSGNIYVIDNEVHGGTYGFDLFNCRNRNVRILNNELEVDKVGVQMQYNSPLGDGDIHNNAIATQSPNSTGILINEFFDAPDYTIADNYEILVPDHSEGISIRSGGSNVVENNQIFANNTNKTLINGTGIALIGTSNNTICSNTTTFSTDASEDSQSKGIFLSAGSSNSIQCNTAYGGTYGFNAWGVADSEIAGNTYSRNYYGTYYGLYPTEANVNTGPQTHTGNYWDNGLFSNNFYGAKHLNQNELIVQQSRYDVDIGEEANFDTPEIAVSDWIRNTNNTGNKFECVVNGQVICGEDNTISFGGESGSTPAMALGLATGDLHLSGNYNAASNWIADFHLYQMVRAAADRGEAVHGDLLYFAQNASSDLATLQAVQAAGLQAAYEPASTTALSNSLDAQVANLLESGTQLDSTTYAQAIANLSQLNAQLHLAYLGQEASFGQAMSNLQSDLNAVSSHATASLYSAVFHDALNMLAGLPIDLPRLNSIAHICPIEGGEAVLMARSILASLGASTVYDDIALCDRPAPRSLAKEEDEHAVRFYPNPSTGKITLEDHNQYQSIEVVSNQGLVLQTIAPVKDQIDLSVHPNGVYLLRFTLIDGRKVTSRIILMK